MRKLNNKKRLIYLTFTLATLIVAFLFNRFYEMLLFTLVFNILHDCFKKRFHANTIEPDGIKANKLCLIITMSVQTFYLLLSISIQLTIYINLIIISTICLTNCLLQDYIELLEEHLIDQVKRKQLNNRVFRGIDMIELEIILNKYEVLGIPNEIMHLFYVERMTISEIAFKLNYSERQIKRIKQETLKILTRKLF